MTKEECDEQLGIAWLRDMAYADETDPDDPVHNGHARGALDAIERRDQRIAELESALATAQLALIEYAEWAPAWKRERDAALARVGALEAVLAALVHVTDWTAMSPLHDDVLTDALAVIAKAREMLPKEVMLRAATGGAGGEARKP